MSGESAFGWLKVVLAIVVIAFLAWLIYWTRTRVTAAVDTMREVVSDTVENLNPVNPGNVFYRGYSNLASYAAGREETLGGWFHSILNRDPVEEMKERDLERNEWNYGGVDTFTVSP